MRDFIGREFNTLLEEADQKVETTKERDGIRRVVQAKLDSGFLGYHVFRGIRRSVVSMIERGEWRKLEFYSDSDAGQIVPGVTIAADGTVVERIPVTDRDGSEAQDLLNQLQNKGYRV